MRTDPVVASFLTALALGGLLTACDKSPTGPSPGRPSEPFISRVEIAGPRTVAPGETAQFSLIAHMTDGSSRDVTNEASWTSGYPAVSIAGPGLITGRERGDAVISAAFDSAGQRLSVGKEVIVVPAGTYRLVGLVSEAGFSTWPVIGARLEVTTGAGAGLFTTTSVDGRYRLYGVSGETTIRVTKDGYQPLARTLAVADHQTIDIEMRPGVPREDRSGTYTLTITAAGDCRVGLGQGHLPEDVRVRSYTGVVTQRGAELEVVLTGATFPVIGGTAHDRFRGSVEPGRVVFLLNFDDGDWPDLLEQLATSTFLVVHGTVVATGPADRLAGMLDGWFQVERDLFFSHIAWCYSASHQFVLSR